MRLEVIGVQHRDRQRPRVPLRAIDLLAQHLLDVAPVEDAGQRIVRRLLEQALARLPLHGDVDDRRQQRVVAGEAQALPRQVRPERPPARGAHLGLEVVDAPVAEDVLQVARRARPGSPSAGARGVPGSRPAPRRTSPRPAGWPAAPCCRRSGSAPSRPARSRPAPAGSPRCPADRACARRPCPPARHARRAARPRPRARPRSPAPARRSPRTSWRAAPRAASSAAPARCARGTRRPPSCRAGTRARRAST